jgi:hypothetical protein
MAKREISKNLMLAAGILAAAVILCSQAFQKETRSFLSKINAEKTEQAADTQKKVIAATPSDAVTSGQAVEVGDADPSFIREIVLGDNKDNKKPALDQSIVSELFKTLFRVFISPQAP